ncbi:MFS transporter [Saccharothrix texasensis]|uniref:MFS transporter n=1 Tax=Saccharothrix texasensis TaxID=103734 RepID=UPI001476E2BB|nr:MFS transporter [Saccharothrix texasensis]
MASSLFLVQFGLLYTSICLPILVLDRYGTVTDLAYAFGARIIPSVLMAPVAARMLTQWDARKLAAVSSVLMAAVTGVLPFAEDFVVFTLLLAAVGITSSVAVAGRMAVRGRVAAAADPVRVNSIVVGAQRVAMLTAPLAAGTTTSAANVALGFLLEAVLLVASSVLLLRLPVPAPPAADPSGARGPSGLLGAVKTYANIVLRPSLAVGPATLSTYGYMIYLGLRQVLLPLYLIDALGRPVSALGFVYTASAIGGIAGAVAARSLSPRRGFIGVFVWCTVIEAVMFSTLFLKENLVWLLVVFLVSGFLEAAATAIFFVIVQTELGNDEQGVFFSFFVPQCELFIGFGVLLAGAFAGVDLLYSLGGTSLVVLLVPLLLFTLPRRRTAQQT